jgi:uncharacterized membrane protein
MITDRGAIMGLLNKLTIGLLCLFFSVALFPSVLAANELIIDDIDFDDPYHAGDIVKATVTLANEHALRDIEDVEIKAWISDNGDRITSKATYELVRVQEEDEEEVYFVLELPRDTLPGVYSFKVTAEGELEDSSTTVSASTFVNLEVEQEEHSVEILDIVAPSRIGAGSHYDVSVVLYNSGGNNERDIRLTLEMPDLGVRKSVSLLKDLREGEEYEVYFKLPVSADAEPGIYTIQARVTNAELSTSYEEYIDVVGRTQGITTTTTTTGAVQDTPTLKTIEPGKGGVFVLNVGNGAGIVKTLNFELAGAQEWASSARVDPSAATLSPGENVELLIYVAPYEGTSGMHTFTLYVEENGQIVSSEQLTVNVASSGVGSGLSAVLFGIIILVVLYVVGKNYYNVNPTKRRKTDVDEIYY